MQEYYILQQEELLILASIFGLERIYGLSNQKEDTEKWVPYKIHEMTRNGVLFLSKDELRVQEPYKTILQSMKKAPVILTARKYVKEQRYFWFYIGEPTVWLEESQMDEGAIKLRLLERKEILKILDEAAFFPEELLDKELAAIEDMQEVRNGMKQLPVYAKFQSMPAQMGNNVKSSELVLTRSRHNYWVSGWNLGNKEILFPYEKESIYSMLWEIVKENRE